MSVQLSLEATIFQYRVPCCLRSHPRLIVLLLHLLAGVRSVQDRDLVQRSAASVVLHVAREVVFQHQQPVDLKVGEHVRRVQPSAALVHQLEVALLVALVGVPVVHVAVTFLAEEYSGPGVSSDKDWRVWLFADICKMSVGLR